MFLNKRRASPRANSGRGTERRNDPGSSLATWRDAPLKVARRRRSEPRPGPAEPLAGLTSRGVHEPLSCRVGTAGQAVRYAAGPAWTPFTVGSTTWRAVPAQQESEAWGI